MMKREMLGWAVAAAVFVAGCDVMTLDELFGKQADQPKTVETPVASLEAGAVPAHTGVVLSTKTAGAVIYYTVNGTDPSVTSTVYKTPVVIDAARTIKAVAKKSGMKDSPVMVRKYTITPAGGAGGNTDGGNTGAGVEPITQVDLTLKIPAPVTGAVPAGYVFEPSCQYTGPVEWSVAGGGAALSGVFQPDTAYTATARLVAISGFFFNGPPAFFHSAGPGPQNVATKDNGNGTFTVTVNFPATAGIGFSGNAAQSGDSAVDMIRAAKQAAQSSVTVILSPGTETVSFIGDADIGTTGLVLTGNDSPAEVVIDGGGKTVQLDAGGIGGSILTVGAGVTLTLRNITFAGKTGNNAALFRVKDGGQLVLEDGAKITGNTHPGGNITYTGSPFTELGFPSGGGIVVHDGGRLTMTGASEISGNTARHGGGVAVHTGGFLTMTGGTISGNTATTGGGVFLVNNGSLAMSGTAAISGNDASGGNGGGVIMYASTFTMIDDAAVSNNHAPGSKGGGLHIHSGTFTMSGNAAISDNTAGPNGGGINSEGGKFDMSGNARINSNSANGGGGVYVGGGMVFTMDGGVIYSNVAKSRGGGVSVASNSTFTMNSGTIYGVDADPPALANTGNVTGYAAASVAGTTSNVGSSDNTIIK